jgi:hypothetical protein
MLIPAEALPLKKLGSGHFFSLIVILRSLITSKLQVVPYIKPYLWRCWRLVRQWRSSLAESLGRRTTNMTVLSEQRLYWVVLFANLIFGVHYMTVTTPHGSAIKGLKSASQVALLLVPDPSHHSTPPIGGFF